MKAEEFDEAFDRGDDVTAALDLGSVRRPALEQRGANVDFPTWSSKRSTGRPGGSG
jgi:hypothetical protein